MSFAEQIAEMFDVDSPEEAARLTITIIAIGIGISLIIYAISILCIAGEAICCLLSLVKCARYLCKCCVDCCGKMTGGSSSSKKEGEVETSSSSSSASPASGSSSGEASRHNVGQLMSLVVMVFSILVALVWEFYFATEMDSARATQDAWSENCDESMSSYPQCLKYQAAYRVAFVATVFFASMSALTASQPAFHNQGWDLKIFCYLALLVGMTFAPNRVFDDHGFIWVARVGAFVFLLLQQVILIDSAYCVNEFLVEKGYRLQNGSSSEGEWNVYLVACLVLSLGLFASAVTGIVLLLVFYTGCDTSNTFISFTLLLVSAFTGLQLFATKPASEGEQGHNFLTSAVVAAYVVYLCFVAVSANPVAACNPTYSQKENWLALVLGLGITFLSITSTVYFASQSFTKLVSANGQQASAAPVRSADLESVLTGGTTTDGDDPAPKGRGSLTRQVTGGLDESDGVGGQSWKFNAVMCLISCYWCCVLTDWGNPGGGASAASPTAGHTAMWMNITASWICSLLYLWTIVAPIMFPNRDFS